MKLQAQIDMEASVSTIKATTVLREGFAMQRTISLLGAFSAGVVKSPGLINEILCFEGLKPRQVAFRVVPDNAQKVDVIMGRNVTEALDLTYTRYED